MATKTKKQTKVVKTKAKVSVPAVRMAQTKAVSLGRKLVAPPVKRVSGLLKRRPHRSFRLTNRRDYKRSFVMPGYWAFTNSVRFVLWKNWRLFGGLAIVYLVVSIVISGFGAQESYSNLAQTLKDSSGDLFKGNFGQVSQAGLLLLSTISTGLSPNPTEAQSILGALALFFGWLATIWLLRNTLAGHKPRLRDGLYNSGSPVLAILVISFIITLQLLPAAIAIIIYSAGQGSGMFENGVNAMLIWSSMALLCLLSIYWITSSFIALVIATLPGMYPMRAIRSSGDLVVGRRLRVLFRMAWLLFIVVLAWALVVIPIILFDDWIKGLLPAISWLPLVPLVILSMGALTLIYVTSYTYLLYRRIVDDDAAPA